MVAFDTFDSVPTGSLAILPDNEREPFIAHFASLPSVLFDMLNAPRTGAYLRGLVKTYDLPLEMSAVVAHTILQIGVGVIPLPQLAGHLSARLRLANDKAQHMAADIERELFSPVSLELQQYLRELKQHGTQHQDRVVPADAVNNMLDLKHRRPPVPPALPSRRST